MFLRVLQQIFHRTLNSVAFGISLMVLVAAYIAVGSGVVEVREFFEMTEMQFFNAWPLKLLMALLVLSLATVTWTRIPLTPPRYGVWCIHSGIILLIAGMALHYTFKMEGMILIPKGQTVGHFYDMHERTLYVKISGLPPTGHALPSLPRFKSYPPGSEVASRLQQDDLQGLEPYIAVRSRNGDAIQRRKLSELLELPHPLTLDVVGYYRYANIVTDFIANPASESVGLRLSMTDPHSGAESVQWLMADHPGSNIASVGSVEVEHRHIDNELAFSEFARAASRLHRLVVKVGDVSNPIDAEVGKSYEIENTGYTLVLERFDPAWPMFGTGEIVQALTMKIIAKSPAEPREFRRMVLSGKPLQTDFMLNVEGAGPMGKRQTEPLDTNLQIDYVFADTMRLLPRRAPVKRTLVTSGGESILDISVGTSRPAETKTFQSGEKVDLFSDEHGHAMKARIERVKGVEREDRVVEVPVEKRTRQEDSAGIMQVAIVRVKSGDWFKDVAVPYTQYAADVGWNEPSVTIPGTRATLSLQLGNTNYDLPARLTLENFELVTYAGGSVNSGAQRDFISTIKVENPETGETFTGQAKMNSPIYFDNGRWLFFQSGWDPDGQRWSVIGVGNRPHVWTMITGCVMIFVGLMYAFYLKPVIIRRMKEKALERAQQVGKVKSRELVEVS